MKNIFFLFLTIFLSTSYGVHINRLNGGLSVTYVDFRVTGDVIPLSVVRSYNSKTALNEKNGWRGAFGWGWTADFESVLTVTPDRHVLLRDGSTGNTVYFKSKGGTSKFDIFRFQEELKKAYFERKLGKKLMSFELKDKKLPRHLISKSSSSAQARYELSAQYGLKGDMIENTTLVSSKYGYETIESKNGMWVRKKNGMTHFF